MPTISRRSGTSGNPSMDFSTPLAATRPTRPYTPNVTTAGLSSVSSHFSETVSVTSCRRAE